MKKIIVLTLAILCINLFSIKICYAEMVMYNTKTHKYHQIWCRWAAKCTVNCIKIDKKEAIKRGGIPCKVCGG